MHKRNNNNVSSTYHFLAVHSQHGWRNVRALDAANGLWTGKRVRDFWERVGVRKMGENMPANSSFYAPLEFPFSAVRWFCARERNEPQNNRKPKDSLKHSQSLRILPIAGNICCPICSSTLWLDGTSMRQPTWFSIYRFRSTLFWGLKYLW